jgi:hypothetical protein
VEVFQLAEHGAECGLLSLVYLWTGTKHVVQTADLFQDHEAVGRLATVRDHRVLRKILGVRLEYQLPRRLGTSVRSFCKSRGDSCKICRRIMEAKDRPVRLR